MLRPIGLPLRGSQEVRANHRMSASGPKQTCVNALQASAFGGKADMAFCGNPLLWSLFGVKRTSHFAAQNVCS
jgi:hypothetical protein